MDDFLTTWGHSGIGAGQESQALGCGFFWLGRQGAFPDLQGSLCSNALSKPELRNRFKLPDIGLARIAGREELG